MRMSRSIRRFAPTLALVGACAAALVLTAAPAAAQQAEATPLGQFGDWAAFATEASGSKMCYALSQPRSRRPEGLSRDPGYLFVSFRPSENVANEVAAVMGFPTQDGQTATGVIDGTSYNFVTRGENVWVQNPAQEDDVVQSFVRGRSFELNVRSGRGNDTTDVYSLSGFTAALNRAKEECGV
ncbi:MAG: invasion associated locus B family protein [Salinarimonas sp.]